MPDQTLSVTGLELQALVPAGKTVILVRQWSYLGQPFLRGPLDEQHLSSDGVYAHGNRGHRDMWAKVSDLVREAPEVVVRCDAFNQQGTPSWLHVQRGSEGIAAICEPCYYAGHMVQATHTQEAWGNRYGCDCCGRHTFTSIGD